MLGVVVIRTRASSDKLFQLKLYTACIRLGLFGFSLAIEMTYVSYLFTEDRVLLVCAFLIFFARLSHVPGGYFILKNLWVKNGQTNEYLELTDEQHFALNSSAYIPILMTMFLDNTAIIYLPWLSTKV